MYLKNDPQKNFLPTQYRRDAELVVRHTYLAEQFADYAEIFAQIALVIEKGDFTLGEVVDFLEEELCEFLGVENVVSVGSGTDAIYLSLRALGIGYGDQVIVPSFTFYATAGAIIKAGATPVFCDVGLDGNIRVEDVQKALAVCSSCKAIVPVHWTGRPVDVKGITEFAADHRLSVVYDACHALGATIDGASVASYGNTAAFSFHPLKNLNVWGDGGFIATNDFDISQRLRLLRNHGLVGRDVCVEFGVNSRLDTIQAVVARHMLRKLPSINEARIKNSHFLDSKLSLIDNISIPERHSNITEVFHLYSFRAERRKDLIKELINKGIDAKVHYPVPLHQQPAGKGFVLDDIDLINSEKLAATSISLPVHEFVTPEQLEEMLGIIKNFYAE